jgi:hypothetical protein
LLLLSAVDVEDGLGEGLGYFVRQGVTDVRPLAPARAATRTPQQSLQSSITYRQWVVTAYAQTFGSYP